MRPIRGLNPLLPRVFALAALGHVGFACGSDTDVSFTNAAGTGGAAAGASPVTSADCGDLAACCLSLAGEERTSCQALAATFAGERDDASCASAVAGYRSINACGGGSPGGDGGTGGAGTGGAVGGSPAKGGNSGKGSASGSGQAGVSGTGGAGGTSGPGGAGGTSGQGGVGGAGEMGGAGAGAGAGGTGGAMGATETQACTLWAASFCARLETCGPVVFHQHYANAAQCAADEASTICPLVFFGQSTFTPAGVITCAGDFAALTCEQVASYVFPASCRPLPGLQAKDEPCVTDVDCASSHCSVGRFYFLSDGVPPVGRCEAPGKAGAACELGDECESRRCDRSKRACLGFEENAASCTQRFACALGWSCLGGECVPPRLAGAPCSADGSTRCSEALGLVCAGGVCAEPTPVPPGAACDRGEVCAFGHYCEFTGFGPGTCVPQGGAGDPCEDGGPFQGSLLVASCLYPLACDGKTKTMGVRIAA